MKEAGGDFVSGGNLSPADMQIIEGDEALKQEYHPHYGDFRTHYFFFDDSQAPFDDLKVRQAFAQVLDRQAIVDNIVKNQGIPAYSFLMPGFPDAMLRDLGDKLTAEQINDIITFLMTLK